MSPFCLAGLDDRCLERRDGEPRGERELPLPPAEVSASSPFSFNTPSSAATLASRSELYAALLSAFESDDEAHRPVPEPGPSGHSSTRRRRTQLAHGTGVSKAERESGGHTLAITFELEPSAFWR